MSESPKTDALSITQQITLLSREPFRNELAKMLKCAPTEAAIRRFANKQPDRWAQAVSILMKGAGYKDNIVQETNFYVQINNMSDAGLEIQLAEIEKELSQLSETKIAGVIEHGQENGDEKGIYEGNEDTAENNTSPGYEDSDSDALVS